MRFGQIRQSTTALASFIVASIFALQLSASEVVTTVAANKSSVQVAEPFEVSIHVLAPDNTRVTFPVLPDKLGNFEVTDNHDLFDIPLEDANGMRSWTRRLILEHLVPGHQIVPSMEIRVSSAAGVETLHTEEIAMDVTSVLENRVDPLSIRDIKDEIDVDVPKQVSHAWVAWLLGGLSATAVVFLAAAQFAHRESISPANWTKVEFQLLRDSETLQRVESNAVFAQLESIVRVFLEAHFGMPAATQSTAELLKSLEHLQQPHAVIERLQGFLLTAERARYAAHEHDSRSLARRY